MLLVKDVQIAAKMSVKQRYSKGFLSNWRPFPWVWGNEAKKCLPCTMPRGLESILKDFGYLNLTIQ
jgi:hypothetical protein